MPDHKDKALLALKKARGTLNKIIKMSEDKEYCVDIMQQNLAVIGLLRSAHESLMEGHLKSCFTNALKAKNNKIKKQMTDEILKVTRLFNK